MLTKHLNIIADLKKANCEIQYYFVCSSLPSFFFFTAIRLKKDHLLLIAANANRLHLKASKTRKVICLNADVSRQISTLRNLRSLFCPFNSNIRFLVFSFMKIILHLMQYTHNQRNVSAFLSIFLISLSTSIMIIFGPKYYFSYA